VKKGGASREVQAVNLYWRACVGGMQDVSVRQYKPCQRLALGDGWSEDRDRHHTRRTAWRTIPTGNVTESR
jgi:hypothetical protein